MDMKIDMFEENTDSTLPKLEELLEKIDSLKREELAILNEQDMKSISNRQRIPWCGNLSEVELNRPGGLLFAALLQCANERRLLLNQLAAELGVSYGYINQLRNGIRNVLHISSEFTTACARFLVVPRLNILILAGIVTFSDLYESDELMASEISKAMMFIYQDIEWGSMITPELRNINLESKFVLVKLYESATGKVLLNNALDSKSLASELTKFKIIQNKRQGVVTEHSHKKSLSISLKKIT